MPDLVPVDYDPFAAAALRTQQSVRPAGGRPEGAATKVLAGYVPHAIEGMAGLPERAFGASEQLRGGGDYDPGPAVETSLMMLGGGTSFGPRGALGAAGRKPPPWAAKRMEGLTGELPSLADVAKQRADAAEEAAALRAENAELIPVDHDPFAPVELRSADKVIEQYKKSKHDTSIGDAIDEMRDMSEEELDAYVAKLHAELDKRRGK